MKEEKILKFLLITPIVAFLIWCCVSAKPLTSLEDSVTAVVDGEGHFVITRSSRQSEGADWHLEATLDGYKDDDVICATLDTETIESLEFYYGYGTDARGCLVDMMALAKNYVGAGNGTDIMELLDEYVNLAIPLELVAEIVDITDLDGEASGIDVGLAMDTKTYEEIKKELGVGIKLFVPKELKTESDTAKYWFDVSRKGISLALLAQHESEDGEVTFDLYLKDEESKEILNKFTLEFQQEEVEEIAIPEAINEKQFKVLKGIVSILRR